MRRPILVTGGAGFLGSHLVDRLLADGEMVFVVDNFSTGDRRNLPRTEQLVVIERDVRDGLLGFSLPDCRQIYNLACPASPRQYQADPVGTVTTNVLGVLSVLELAKSWRARVLQASTSEVYGDPATHPQPETYLGNVNPIGPRACYDEGKRVAETLCADFRRQFQVDSVIVRIFNTYGPRMGRNDGRVVSNLIAAALAGGAFHIAGDGRHTRSFCYVDDTVDGLVRAMNSTLPGPFNIGNPEEISINDLVRLVSEVLDKPIANYQGQPAVDDPRRRCPDISRAQLLLGWSPSVDLREGLESTILWMQNDLPGHSAVAISA